MKVMISLPMNGKKDQDVIARMLELKSEFEKLHIEVIDSFIKDEAPLGTIHPNIYYLGRTLKNFLSEADAVYFDDGWREARGCRIERKVCEEYGIKILDSDFLFPKPIFTTRAPWDNNGIHILPCSTPPQKEQYTVTCSDIDKHVPRID